MYMLMRVATYIYSYVDIVAKVQLSYKVKVACQVHAGVFAS